MGEDKYKNFAIMVPSKATQLPYKYAIPIYSIINNGTGLTLHTLIGYKLRYVTVILPKQNP